MRCGWAITCSKDFIEQRWRSEGFCCARCATDCAGVRLCGRDECIRKGGARRIHRHAGLLSKFHQPDFVLALGLRAGFSGLRTSRIGLHILRAVGGLLSQAFMFAAVKKMALVDAVLLSNSAPLFIPLVAWVWLKEKIGGMVWVSLSIGFAGVILILRPSLALLSNPVALSLSARRSSQPSRWSRSISSRIPNRRVESCSITSSSLPPPRLHLPF